MDFLSISEVARQLGVPPKTITDLCYRRIIPDDACPIIAGRRLVPKDYLPELTTLLRDRGLLVQQSSIVVKGGGQ